MTMKTRPIIPRLDIRRIVTEQRLLPEHAKDWPWLYVDGVCPGKHLPEILICDGPLLTISFEVEPLPPAVFTATSLILHQIGLPGQRHHHLFDLYVGVSKPRSAILWLISHVYKTPINLIMETYEMSLLTAELFTFEPEILGVSMSVRAYDAFRQAHDPLERLPASAPKEFTWYGHPIFVRRDMWLAKFHAVISRR